MKFPAGQQSNRKPLFKTKIQRRGLILLITSLLAITWLFMYYMHTNRQIKKYSQEVERLATEQHSLYQIKKKNKQLDQNVSQLKRKLRSSHRDFITQEKNLPQRQMTLIAQEAQKIGLSLKSCVAQEEKNKSWFSKQNVTYNVQGNIEKISQFINKIKKIGRSFKCKKIVFNKIAPGSTCLECILQLIHFDSQMKYG